MKPYLGLQSATDGLASARLLERDQYRGAHLGEAGPLFGRFLADSAGKRIRFGKFRLMHAARTRCTLRKRLPNLFGGEYQDGRQQADQGAGDFPDGGLRGTPRFASGRFGVKAVLQHVEVKRAEVHYTVIVNGVVYAMKII